MAGAQSTFLKQKSLLRDNLDTKEDYRKAGGTVLVTRHPRKNSKKIQKILPQPLFPSCKGVVVKNLLKTELSLHHVLVSFSPSRT